MTEKWRIREGDVYVVRKDDGTQRFAVAVEAGAETSDRRDVAMLELNAMRDAHPDHPEVCINMYYPGAALPEILNCGRLLILDKKSQVVEYFTHLDGEDIDKVKKYLCSYFGISGADISAA